MTRLALALALCAATLAPGTAARAATADPTAAGSRAFTRVDYDAGPTVLAPEVSRGPDTPNEASLSGEVFVPDGSGRFPVLLFLHGRHGTCAVAGAEGLGDPYPATPATAPIPSYRGYDYLAANLASHGYLVMSIDANGINSYDLPDPKAGALARAQLISRSLDLLAKWNTSTGPAGVEDRLRGHVDLARLWLMGHSRGGEGVSYWIGYNRTRTDGTRYAVSAVFALAPIDATAVAVSGVPWATLLPRCDGDVYDLEGAPVFERSKYDVAKETAPQFQYVVDGADHNWFNTVWVGDDQSSQDSACSPQSRTSIRLTHGQQQRVGLAVMAAFLRRYVGGERQFDPYLTGAKPWRPACSGGLRVPCDALVRTSYLPPAARRVTLSRAFAGLAVSGGADLAACDADCPAQGTDVTNQANRSLGPQATLTWSGAGTVTLRHGGRLDVRRFAAFVVRAAANAATANPHGSQNFAVEITDASGRTAAVAVAPYTFALSPPPGDLIRNLVLSDVRVPLARFRGVDLGAVVTVRLRVGRTRTGSLQVADAAFA